LKGTCDYIVLKRRFKEEMNAAGSTETSVYHSVPFRNPNPYMAIELSEVIFFLKNEDFSSIDKL
jgi:hypothetical protein